MKLTILTTFLLFLAVSDVQGFAFASSTPSNRVNHDRPERRTWLQGIKDTMKDATSNVVGAGKSAGEAAKEGYDAAKEKGKDAYESGKDMAKEGYETSKDAVKDTYDATKKTASNAKDTVKDGFNAAKDGVKEGIDEATN